MIVINKHLIILISILVSFGNFIFGYSLVAISMMEDPIAQENSLNGAERDYQLSIITTLLPLGGFLATFLTNRLSNLFGERKAMIYLDVFALIVITYQAHHISLTSLYMTRFFLGAYLGISSSILPSYLVSISPPELSGLIGSFQQLLLTIGICVAYRLGMSSYFVWQNYNQFPGYFCLARIATLIFFKFDTLERHYRHGEHELIQKYIDLFYQGGTLEELARIRQFQSGPPSSQIDIQVFESKEKGLWGILQNITSGTPKVIVLMGLVLAFSNQLSGINAIIYYAKQIFEHIVTPQQALINTYYLGLLQMVVTLLSGFMINNYGRRTLMLLGSSIIVFSLFMGFFFDSIYHNEKVVIGLIFLHIIGFSLSLGPVTFIYAAQLMENVSFVLIVNWILTIMVSLLSQIMIKAIGIGKVFLFFGICSFLCLSYLYRNMVESKGLSRHELVEACQRGRGYRSLKDEKIEIQDEIDPASSNEWTKADKVNL